MREGWFDFLLRAFSSSGRHSPSGAPKWRISLSLAKIIYSVLLVGSFFFWELKPLYVWGNSWIYPSTLFLFQATKRATIRRISFTPSPARVFCTFPSTNLWFSILKCFVAYQITWKTPSDAESEPYKSVINLIGCVIYKPPNK